MRKEREQVVQHGKCCERAYKGLVERCFVLGRNKLRFGNHCARVLIEFVARALGAKTDSGHVRLRRGSEQ